MNSFGMSMLLLAQAVSPSGSQATPPAASESDLPGWLMFLIVLAILALPFALGRLIAQLLRVKEFATRIGVSLFMLTLFSMPFVQQMINGHSPLNAISLGIDLAGGTNLTYEIDRQQAAELGKEINKELMDRMVSAVSRRVNPTGTEEVTVRAVGADRIEVIVPGADEERKEQVKRRIVALGKLEFHILANQNDHANLIQLGEALPHSETIVTQGGKVVAMWRPSAVVPGTNEPKVSPGDRVVFRDVERAGRPVREFLVVVDPDPNQHITGRLLRNVREQIADTGLVVAFTFNERGGQLMQRLTARYQPREGAGYKSRLAILLNGEIHSAPVINGVIGAQGVIEGRFTQEEIDELISVLNAGALEVPLKEQPVNEFTVSPLLGVDVQRKGITAMWISLVAVFLVTASYYLVAGLVADVCLAMNVILVVGAMSVINATFTLPGLAGLVLTIGMAVDANVLIFERMREERARGSSLRMSIKNGFEKAFSTIFDSNVTTLITAAILYYIGTDQVRGFAVTLFVGICMSMFTALYVGRLIFELSERKRWLKELRMFSLIHSENFDFVGKTRYAVMCSIVMIAVGLSAVAARGSNNLDIDFRGGSMITFQFERGSEIPTIDEVRRLLAATLGEEPSLERLTLQEGTETRTLYRMRTVNSNVLEVSDKIKAAFANTPHRLIEQQATVGEIVELKEGDVPPPADAVGPDPYAGGHAARFSVKESMTARAIAEEAQAALQSIEVGGTPKYPDPEQLVSAVAVDAAAGAVKTNEFQVRFAKAVDRADVELALRQLKQDLDGEPHFEEINTFDTSVAGETKVAAVNAILLSLGAIIAYLWFRFQRVAFGVAACVALVHDVMITVGLMALGSYLSGNPVGALFGLIDFKINLPVVAALLTVIGYSLNDTIVVFDRIREVRGRNPALTPAMVNQSLNQTLSRTILTSMTTLVVLLVLYVMGGEGIHGFAFCLIMGILVGTYSSIYVASPVLIWLHSRMARRGAIF